MSEEALAKTGPELFKELLRLYDTAEVEDYFKNGAWKNDLMKTDLVLIEAHRKEAGAPDPPTLEDVKLPDMPAAAAGAMGLLQQKMALGALTAGATGVGAAAGPVAELRLIALFVAKWKLDPTKTKMLLAKLNPQRRRYVIQNFKATASGEAGATELESYITECEANGQWDKATLPVSGIVPAAGAARPTYPVLVKPATGLTGLVKPAFTPAAAATGIKRPLTSAITPAATRPRLGLGLGAAAATTPAAGAPQTAAGALAARLAAARAANAPKATSPGMIRPASAPSMIRPVGQVAGGAVKPAGGLVKPAIAKAGAAKAGAAKAGAAKAPSGALIRNLLTKF
jgi:hypothetical protein